MLSCQPVQHASGCSWHCRVAATRTRIARRMNSAPRVSEGGCQASAAQHMKRSGFKRMQNFLQHQKSLTSILTYFPKRSTTKAVCSGTILSRTIEIAQPLRKI